MVSLWASVSAIRSSNYISQRILRPQKLEWLTLIPHVWVDKHTNQLAWVHWWISNLQNYLMRSYHVMYGLRGHARSTVAIRLTGPVLWLVIKARLHINILIMPTIDCTIAAVLWSSTILLCLTEEHLQLVEDDTNCDALRRGRALKGYGRHPSLQIIPGLGNCVAALPGV
jgi:hypothetical protein